MVNQKIPVIGFLSDLLLRQRQEIRAILFGPVSRQSSAMASTHVQLNSYSYHRMIQGSPLYYQPEQQEFTYFNRFEMAHSPLSPASQSETESESSISSVEIPAGKLKCCWRNCGLYFESLDLLASHVGCVHGTCSPGGLFYCGWEGCVRNDRAFNARYKMLVHVRTHTNEKPHRCFQCHKSFSRAENLKIHIRSHSGEKPYQCPVPGCTKAYSNSSDRFKHTRTHQVDKPYQCKVPGCPKRYTDPSSLRKHVKTFKHFAQCKENDKDTNSTETSICSSRLCQCTCRPCMCKDKGDVLVSLNTFHEVDQCVKWYNNDAPLDLSIGNRRK